MASLVARERINGFDILLSVMKVIKISVRFSPVRAVFLQILYWRGHRRPLLGCLIIALLLSGCANAPIFPLEVVNKVDRTVTFENVAANPDHYQRRVVELGGQIVGSLTEEEQVYLLVRELPIRTTPLYGPFDTAA